MTPKNKTKTLDAAIVLIESLGAKKLANNYEEWELQTPLGVLKLAPRCIDGKGIEFFSKFQDPALAGSYLYSEINPYTGKWNHSYTGTLEDAISGYRRELNRILSVNAKSSVFGRIYYSRLKTGGTPN